MFYDSTEQKIKRKTFFSYGFLNNETELSRTENEIKFNIIMEPLPKQFQGTKWRSFIRKISEQKVIVGLETAKEGEPFTTYGEEELIRKT